MEEISRYRDNAGKMMERRPESSRHTYSLPLFWDNIFYNLIFLIFLLKNIDICWKNIIILFLQLKTTDKEKNMKTKHVIKRMQQRGRSALDLSVIGRYGETHRGGGIRLLTNRKAKRAINRFRQWLKRKQNVPMYSRRVARVRKIVSSIEKTRNWMMISALGNSGEMIITIYPANRARQRKFFRSKCRLPVSSFKGK